MVGGREGPESGRPGELSPSREPSVATPVLLLLIWLVGASAAVILYLGSKLTFFLDDWEFLFLRPGFNADAIFAPHGEHIVVLPVIIYKALMATAGIGSALPYRVVSTALFLLSAVLLFVYLRRRLGQWAALVGTAVVLFLGAAWEDLLWSFQVGYFGCMASGLAALLALDREDRRGDLVACALLAVAVLFSSLGLPFAFAAAAAVLLRPGRRGRLYVFLVPLAVYAAWWLGWGHDAESALSAANVAKTPAFVYNSLAAGLASLFGLAGPAVEAGNGGLEWGRPLAVAAIGLGLWRGFRLGRPSPQLWVVLVLAASFVLLAGLNEIQGRSPVSSRYQYIYVVFLLLIAAELLRGWRLDPRRSPAAFATVVVFALASIAGNLYYLHQGYSGYHETSRLEKAALGAVEIASDTVAPNFLLTEELIETGYVHVEAGAFLAARNEFGSPGYDPEELATAPSRDRFVADKVLFAALEMGLQPVPASAVGGLPTKPAPAGGEVAVPADGCLSVDLSGGASALLQLPLGGVGIRAGAEPIEEVDLTRFAVGEFPIQLTEPIAARHAVELAIPRDHATLPWKMQLRGSGRALVCGLAGPAEP